jgi:hypothetical protein
VIDGEAELLQALNFMFRGKLGTSFVALVMTVF